MAKKKPKPMCVDCEEREVHMDRRCQECWATFEKRTHAPPQPKKINLQLSVTEAEALSRALVEVLEVFESAKLSDIGPVRDLARVFEKLEDKLNG
jgi:hypothetical protein